MCQIVILVPAFVNRYGAAAPGPAVIVALGLPYGYLRCAIAVADVLEMLAWIHRCAQLAANHLGGRMKRKNVTTLLAAVAGAFAAIGASAETPSVAGFAIGVSLTLCVAAIVSFQRHA